MHYRLTGMAHVNTTLRGAALVAALAFLSLGLAACSDDEKSASFDTSANEQEPAAPADQSDGDGSLSGGDAVLDSTTGDSGTGTSNPPGSPLAPTTRKLVITMTVGLEVADASAAVDRVIQLATIHGGQLYDSSIDLGDPRFAQGNLVFKMPPDEVEAFLSGLDPAIGRRTSLDGTTSDVTNQLTDLDAQIETARASVERVRELMDRAETLADIVPLENELTPRQTRLEQLLAQQSNLEGLVAMATITVYITTAPEEPVAADTDDGTSISEAFRDGWDAFVGVLRGIVVFLGYTMPFLVLGAIGGLIGWRIRRSPRNRAAAPPPLPAPGADQRTSEPDSAGPAKTL